MRTRFEEKLAEIHNSLIQMGILIENAIALSIKALMEQNAALAKKAITCDNEIDEMERQIESQCLKLILHQQPIAGDLRLISTALKMVTDMERIGDHATDISEITLILSDRIYIKEMEHIPQMAEATTQMVSQSIDAYVNKDLALAEAVILHDDVVDELFCIVKDDLIGLIREDIHNGEQAMDLLMIAKYFERIGDHAVNIAEWVIFSLTGVYKNQRII